MCIFVSQKTRYSAVGSAPRSGRGGRAFESPYLDKNTLSQSFLNQLILLLFIFLFPCRNTFNLLVHACYAYPICISIITCYFSMFGGLVNNTYLCRR